MKHNTATVYLSPEQEIQSESVTRGKQSRQEFQLGRSRTEAQESGAGSGWTGGSWTSGSGAKHASGFARGTAIDSMSAAWPTEAGIVDDSTIQGSTIQGSAIQGSIGQAPIGQDLATTNPLPDARSSFRSATGAAGTPLHTPEHHEPVVTPAAKPQTNLEQRQRQAPPEFSKQGSFMHLAGLIANMTESYTVMIFEADRKQKVLRAFAHHSLSRDLLQDERIPFGSGLVGWTAENRVRISVCPFERDASSLLYYSCDQALKSFIAVPVLDAKDGETLVGVIACDSKKSYAYSKTAEKVLLDAAQHAAILFELFNSAGHSAEHRDSERRQEQLGHFLEKLRKAQDEVALMETARELPSSLIDHDAVVLAVPSSRGMGHAHFYPATARNDVEHRLMQIVCKHKKLKTSGKSVHSLPLDDKQQRSFLSIPIRILDSEAGSFNLLSRPQEAFTTDSISMLEQIATEVGIMLERLRLRESALSRHSVSALLPWPEFKQRAEAHIKEAQKERKKLELLRLSFGSLSNSLEREVGADVALAAVHQLARLLEQAAVPDALCGRVYGEEFLLLVDAQQSAKIVGRFQRLLQRLRFSDITRQALTCKKELSDFAMSVFRVSASEFPREGKGVVQLLQNCRIALDQQDRTGQQERTQQTKAQGSTTVQSAKTSTSNRQE